MSWKIIEYSRLLITRVLWRKFFGYHSCTYRDHSSEQGSEDVCGRPWYTGYIASWWQWLGRCAGIGFWKVDLFPTLGQAFPRPFPPPGTGSFLFHFDIIVKQPEVTELQASVRFNSTAPIIVRSEPHSYNDCDALICLWTQYAKSYTEIVIPANSK